MDLQAKPSVTVGGKPPTRLIGRLCRSGSELRKKVRVTDFGSTSCAASRKRNVSPRYGVGSTLYEGRVSSLFTAREFRIRNCRSSNFDALEYFRGKQSPEARGLQCSMLGATDSLGVCSTS